MRIMREIEYTFWKTGEQSSSPAVLDTVAIGSGELEMRIPRALGFRLALVAVAVLLLFWLRHSVLRHRKPLVTRAVPDRSVTNPLNQPGGGSPPAEAYEIYSALYQAPNQEPLAFAEDSVTDIPQVDGSCLKPSTPREREMTEAFEAANRQTHRWENKFAIPEGYRLLSESDAKQAQACLESHGNDGAQCATYKDLRHIRFLGVPGLDRAGTRALVSVVKMCGRYCGNGGIFEVEKAGGAWRRTDTTDFTSNCSWMY
jgi:hypothetical protein